MSYDGNDLQDEFGDDLDDIAYEIAGLRRERDALAAQLEAARQAIEARRDEELATIASVAAGAFGSSAAKRQYRAKHKATADALEWVLDLLDAQPAAVPLPEEARVTTERHEALVAMLDGCEEAARVYEEQIAAIAANERAADRVIHFGADAVGAAVTDEDRTAHPTYPPLTNPALHRGAPAVSLPEEAEPLDDRLWLSSSDPHMDGSETVAVKKYPDPHRHGTVTVTVPSGYDLRPLPWFLAALAPAVSLELPEPPPHPFDKHMDVPIDGSAGLI